MGNWQVEMEEAAVVGWFGDPCCCHVRSFLASVSSLALSSWLYLLFPLQN